MSDQSGPDYWMGQHLEQEQQELNEPENEHEHSNFNTWREWVGEIGVDAQYGSQGNIGYPSDTEAVPF